MISDALLIAPDCFVKVSERLVDVVVERGQLRRERDEARALVRQCHRALQFLQDAGCMQWIGNAAYETYDAMNVTPEDLEQLAWLRERDQ